MNRLEKLLFMTQAYFKKNFSNNNINDNHVYLIESPCIIESQTTANGWYRVWSDGWCEQGGIINTTIDLEPIIFAKPFIDAPVAVFSNPYNQASSHTTDKNWLTVNLNITRTGFNIRHWDSDGNTLRKGTVCWEAKGLVRIN